eukprot:74188-Chlamydomonas_euryale.AAC.1
MHLRVRGACNDCDLAAENEEIIVFGEALATVTVSVSTHPLCVKGCVRGSARHPWAVLCSSTPPSPPTQTFARAFVGRGSHTNVGQKKERGERSSRPLGRPRKRKERAQRASQLLGPRAFFPPVVHPAHCVQLHV